MKCTVVDASMAAAWTLEDERTPEGDRILAEVEAGFLITTTVFWHEYRNLLVTGQRRGRFNAAGFPRLLKQVIGLQIQEIKQERHEWILELAALHALSAYDAAYLALALEFKATLASNDHKLARAAQAVGVELCTILDGV